MHSEGFDRFLNWLRDTLGEHKLINLTFGPAFLQTITYINRKRNDSSHIIHSPEEFHEKLGGRIHLVGSVRAQKREQFILSLLVLVLHFHFYFKIICDFIVRTVAF